MRLVVIEVPGLPPGTTQPQEFDFDADPYRSVWLIGRQLGNNIHLVDPSVSRNHAELMIDQQGVIVRDLGSINGTFINEQPLPPETPTLLRPGDRLRIGNVVTLLEAGPLGALSDNPTVVKPAPYYARNAGPPSQPASMPLPPTESLRDKPAQAPAPAPTPMPAPARAPGFPGPPASPVYGNYPQPPADRPAYPSVYQPLIGQEFAPPAHPASVRPNTPARSVSKPSPLPKARRSGFPLKWVLGLILLLLLTAGAYFLYAVVLSPASSGKLPTIALTSGVFSSPANSDAAVGLTVSHPSNWQKNAVSTNQVIFYLPQTPTVNFNIEKPPSPTITDPSLTPEGVIRQYLANVKANASKSQIPATIYSTQLKDGTPAVLARLVFSTTGSTVVNDYTMTALSFRCSSGLYFVSAAAEAKDYNGAVQQDLEAAIANVACSK